MMIEFAKDAEDCTEATLRSMGHKTKKVLRRRKGALLISRLVVAPSTYLLR